MRVYIWAVCGVCVLLCAVQGASSLAPSEADPEAILASLPGIDTACPENVQIEAGWVVICREVDLEIEATKQMVDQAMFAPEAQGIRVEAGQSWFTKGKTHKHGFHIGRVAYWVELRARAGLLIVKYPRVTWCDDPDVIQVFEKKAPEVSDTKPQLIVGRLVQPDYPVLARDARIQASLKLMVLIDVHGVPTDLCVAQTERPYFGFEAAALEAIRQWRYEPARKDGRPVPDYFPVVWEFKLD